MASPPLPGSLSSNRADGGETPAWLRSRSPRPGWRCPSVPWSVTGRQAGVGLVSLGLWHVLRYNLGRSRARKGLRMRNDGQNHRLGSWAPVLVLDAVPGSRQEELDAASRTRGHRVRAVVHSDLGPGVFAAEPETKADTDGRGKGGSASLCIISASNS